VNTVFNGFIGRRRENRVFNILFVNDNDKDQDSDSENKEDSNDVYNKENTIVQEIINNIAIAVYNASVDCEIMAGGWRITN